MAARALPAQAIQQGDSAKRFPVAAFYQPANAPALAPWARWATTARPLDELVETINASYALPKQIVVVYQQCGAENAYFLPKDNTIRLCYELAVRFGQFYSGANREAYASAVTNSMEFVLYHELGHALVSNLALPVTGKEEDAVDQLAAYVLLSAGDAASVAKVWQAAITWRAWARHSGPITRGALADEHSLNEQRYYNLLCYIAGSRPATYTAPAIQNGLTPERARRCPNEFEQLRRAWSQFLAPVMRPVDYEPLRARALVTVYDPSADSRPPRVTFDSASLSRIGLRLRFVFPPAIAANTEPVIAYCSVTRSDGTAMGRVKFDMTPKDASWVNEVASAAFGFSAPGRWDSGPHGVVCAIDDTVVASTAFVVR